MIAMMPINEGRPQGQLMGFLEVPLAVPLELAEAYTGRPEPLACRALRPDAVNRAYGPTQYKPC